MANAETYNNFLDVMLKSVPEIGEKEAQKELKKCLIYRNKLFKKIEEYRGKYSKNGASPEKLKEHITERLNSGEISQLEFQEMYALLTNNNQGRKTLESQTALFKIYFKEKNDNARLQELAELKENYDSCRNKIIESHMNDVIAIAKKHMRYGANLGDLISAGFNGLIYAIADYKPKKGGFRVHAYSWIEGLISRFYQDHLILHVGTKNEISRYQKVIREYKGGHDGKNPPLEKVAKKLKLSLERINYLAKAADYSTLSLDMIITDSEKTMENVILAEDKEIDNSIVNEDIKRFLDNINGREKEIIYMLFDHNYMQEYIQGNRASTKKGVRTLQEVGDILGISRERVRQIRENIFKKLKEEIKKERLKNYLTQ